MVSYARSKPATCSDRRVGEGSPHAKTRETTARGGLAVTAVQGHIEDCKRRVREGLTGSLLVTQGAVVQGRGCLLERDGYHWA